MLFQDMKCINIDLFHIQAPLIAKSKSKPASNAKGTTEMTPEEIEKKIAEQKRKHRASSRAWHAKFESKGVSWLKQGMFLLILIIPQKHYSSTVLKGYPTRVS